MLIINAYHSGPIPPNTNPIAIAPKETCPKPSPIKAKFLINKNVPRKPATMATINEASKGLWNYSRRKYEGNISPGI